MSNCIVGTGYHYRSEFDERMAKRWHANTREAFAGPIVVITTGCEFPVRQDHDMHVIIGANVGHVGDLIAGTKTDELCGWSASILALAMIAYNFRMDLCFKEQDCLAFGPWIETMYQDIGDAGIVFGGKMDAPPYMPCAQGLFLLRYEWILTFVKEYIGMGRDADTLPEHKFCALKMPTATLSFGVDRCRPIPWDEPVWYAQQWTDEELFELDCSTFDMPRTHLDCQGTDGCKTSGETTP